MVQGRLGTGGGEACRGRQAGRRGLAKHGGKADVAGAGWGIKALWVRDQSTRQAAHNIRAAGWVGLTLGALCLKRCISFG